MSGSVAIPCGDEEKLQAAVASVGPVAVAVDGRNKAFRVRRCHTYFRVGVFNSKPE